MSAALSNSEIIALVAVLEVFDIRDPRELQRALTLWLLRENPNDDLRLIELLGEGKTNAEIATEFNLSDPSTAQRRITKLCDRLHLTRNQVQAFAGWLGVTSQSWLDPTTGHLRIKRK